MARLGDGWCGNCRKRGHWAGDPICQWEQEDERRRQKQERRYLLATRLAGYAMHRGNCNTEGWFHKNKKRGSCTCGLVELLIELEND